MIGIVSDTHSWLDPQLLEVFDGASHIIHAGDIGQEHVLEQLKKLCPVTAVKGNIDGGPLRFLPLEATLQVEQVKLATRHIAGSPSRCNAATRQFLTTQKPTVFIAGHSHIFAVTRVHNTLWLNPGAAGKEGFHTERTAMRLYINREDGALQLERVELGPRV